MINSSIKTPALWLDIKYAKFVGHKLSRFKIKKDTGSEFCASYRCPICGDSQKSERKTRGNLYTVDSELFAKCFNCGSSLHFSNLLKIVDHALYSQYKMEKFGKENRKEIETHKLPVVPKLENGKFNQIFDSCLSIQELNNTHPAKQYVMNRMIPESFWDELYYTPKFYTWSQEHTDKFKDVFNAEHPRLLIPWYDKNNNVFAYHARAFGTERSRYYSIVLDKTVPRFYGMDRLNTSNRIYCVEGQIDSMFLPNAIAVGGSSLNSFDIIGADIVYCYDNQPRNKEIVKLVEKTIDEGKIVSLIPEDIFVWKDINEAIMAGQTSEDMVCMIDKYASSGLKAKIMFNQWSKI